MHQTVIHYIDDDPEDIEFFQYAIDTIHQQIILHTHTKEASLFAALRNEKHANQILFLDINMPGKNGIEILKEIRKSEALQKTPVIMYSTTKDAGIIELCQQFGANLYAIKPVSFSSIGDIINKIIAINWHEFKPESNTFVISASV